MNVCWPTSTANIVKFPFVNYSAPTANELLVLKSIIYKLHVRFHADVCRLNVRSNFSNISSEIYHGYSYHVERRSSKRLSVVTRIQVLDHAKIWRKAKYRYSQANKTSKMVHQSVPLQDCASLINSILLTEYTMWKWWQYGIKSQTQSEWVLQIFFIEPHDPSYLPTLPLSLFPSFPLYEHRALQTCNLQNRFDLRWEKQVLRLEVHVCNASDSQKLKCWCCMDTINNGHTHTHIRTYKHAYTYTHTHTHPYITRTHIRKYTQTHTCIYIHTHTHTHPYIHTHSHTYTHTHIAHSHSLAHSNTVYGEIFVVKNVLGASNHEN